VTTASSTFRQWLRHNATAVVATGVDYAVMVLLVELAHVGPVAATAVGSLAGAVTSFTMGRHFTYRVANVPARAQAWRYALVSAASLGLNAAGEYLFFHVIGLQYLMARVITSIIVNNAWNYPMQRFFVFSRLH
jgi:putative flippase GtrA